MLKPGTTHLSQSVTNAGRVDADEHLNAEQVREYWERRAATDSGSQSTTMDVYLRDIEFQALASRIEVPQHATIADVGCGDGRTTAKLAARFPSIAFRGIDFCSNMLRIAHGVVEEAKLSNLTTHQQNVCDGLEGRFDLIFTTRCLINVPSWELQRRALRNIHNALNDGGTYLMVENFIEGHASMNKLRVAFGLPEISIRSHNLFFERRRLLEFLTDMFQVTEEVNISSTYYMVTRVIYSKLCLDAGKSPNYFDDHHRLAADLPFSGEYGPMRLLSLKKR
jgi:trans-aconitate methyltransferase